MSEGALLELAHVSKRYAQRQPLWSRLRGAPAPGVTAVDDVSLAVAEAEILGLVGESGCGKTTAGRIASGTIAASRGEVRYAGESLAALTGGKARRQRLAVQMVFQNPRDALNPRHRIERILAEPPLRHGFATPFGIGAYVDALLASVGLDRSFKSRFPHELSGGQCQRVGIARALSVAPSVIVCDEPISALDVSVQAQILNLFRELREAKALAYLFISHDLSAVERLCDRVAVMYLGRIVEVAEARTIFARAHHPYTQALLAAAPRLDRRGEIRKPLAGEVPSPLRPPAGCHFHPRCPRAMARCAMERPALREIAPGHRSACHLDRS